MNISQIETTLQGYFNDPFKVGEERQIVFWMDTDKEFTEDIDGLELDGVKVQILKENNQFYMKHLLEEEDTTSNYLIYTNLELSVEDNWLADIVLYSKVFYADRVSLILSELNIDSSLRSTVKIHERFFNNKERFRKFKAFDIEFYTEEKIELAIMSALCNLKTPDFEEVLKTVLIDNLDDDSNKYLTLMDKFFEREIFWKYVENYYGYEREKKTLKTLLIQLSVTAFSHSVDEKYLPTLKDFISDRNKSNALVFVDHWMHHKNDYDIFDEYARVVEQEILLPSLLEEIDVDVFKQADTFPYVDKAIIIHIAESLMDNLEDYEEYTKLIKLRRSKHHYEKYAAIYEALYYAIKMYEFRKEYELGIPQGQAISIFKSYSQNYYLMDQYYRKFYVSFDKKSDSELMKKLKGLVEHLYTDWFMGELSTNWSQAVKSEMTGNWSLPGVVNQQKFYSTSIAEHIRNDERVFIIVSDALRYEVAVELSEQLNSETIGNSEIDAMLGVVPSVTKLGMASLLPHRNLDIDSNGRVFVDDKDSSGLKNRKEIIKSTVKESTAIHFTDVLEMSRDDRREYFKGNRLNYIYHDTIDATGDNASTEIYTFNAVERTLDQLHSLVRIIRGDLSGTNIYITSDHGFIYQREDLEESDKIKSEIGNVVELKRRYVLSRENKEVSGQLTIDLSSVIENSEEFSAYAPNGTIRNRMQGPGVNFVHGGASLQEVVVPLISYKNKRAGQKGIQEIKKVDIKLTSTTRRITNSIFNLDFFQTEKVADKTIPRTVVIYMADADGNVLSNEETVIGDREFDNPEDRTFKLRFVLKNISYDRNKTYYLTIKDTETDVFIEQVPFSINLGIINDFDF